jgi:hypothetical protein
MKDKAQRWTWQVGDKNLLESLVYDHLSNHPLHGQKQMILKALIAFYGPLACMESKTISEIDREEIYKSARYDLQRQLEILDRVFTQQQESIPAPITMVGSRESKPTPPKLSFSALME